MAHGSDDVVSWQLLVLPGVRSVQVRNSASNTRSRVGNSSEPRDGEANRSLQPPGQPAAICFSPDHDYEFGTVTTLTCNVSSQCFIFLLQIQIQKLETKMKLDVYRGNRRPTCLCEGNDPFPVVSKRFAGHYYYVQKCLSYEGRTESHEQQFFVK